MDRQGLLMTMAQVVAFVLVLLAAGGLAEPAKKVLPQKTADQTFLKKQMELMELFYHVHEPTFIPEHLTVLTTWDIEKNIDHFSNITALKIWGKLFEHDHILPRGVPFDVFHNAHQFEAVTVFHVLYSAKDYTTFYKTACYLRNIHNEGLFIYALSVAILHRHDTQGIVIPPIYEIFPSFFHNGEIMTTAQRINVQGHHWVEHHPSTYIWNSDVVIRWNATVWPYFNEDNSVAYFTHDHRLNAFYYNEHLAYPFWLGGETVTLSKDRRGERFWFLHKQLLTRYYMERLSNGLGEIPELGDEVVNHGYQSGLLYHNGIPYPSRPHHFHLTQHHLVDEMTMIHTWEQRVRDAIESGYIINHLGEHVSIHHQDAIDIVGRLIEANVDSPNALYYKDFITMWKIVLGNSWTWDHAVWHNDQVPLLLPSVLEHYQTALRDPAFWMIWKHVMKIFTLWHQQLPHYKPEELALPSVNIEKVEVDKLVTYFEYSYVNVTNHLHMTEEESHTGIDHVSVLVQHPQLNHKVFQTRVHVKSDIAKTVIVRLFLAPKYDSHGYEIPLHHNTENFFLLDMFKYDLPQGEHVIRRDSTENIYTSDDWHSAHDLYVKAEEAHHGKGQFVLDQSHRWNGFPQRLVLPKGRVGGMPFVFLVYISEYHAPKVQFGTGFDPAVSLGLGSGAVSMSDEPYGFPLNRPLYWWQIKDLHNIHLQDVHIHHKPTPDIDVPHTE